MAFSIALLALGSSYAQRYAQMKMIFGNKKDFAIQAIIEPNLKPPSSVWGRFSVWVENVSIGDYNEEHCRE